MILVDSRVGSIELKPHIRQCGVVVDDQMLEYGDAYFEGNGPKGTISIGVERKTIQDMLNCIEDHRYNAQRVGMNQMYDKSFLILEGQWAPSNGCIPGLSPGYLCEPAKGGWRPFSRRAGAQPVLYAKLYRYLVSVQLSGVIVTQSKDMAHTAFNICELYRYFQKRWSDHTSLLEKQKLSIPTLESKPRLVRRWASEITDIGVKYGLEAERIFKTGYGLAMGQERDWMRIKGIGAKTAIQIVKEIMER